MIYSRLSILGQTRIRVRPSLGSDLQSPEFFSRSKPINKGNDQDRGQIRNRVRPPLGHHFLSPKFKSWTRNRVTLMLKASI